MKGDPIEAFWKLDLSQSWKKPPPPERSGSPVQLVSVPLLCPKSSQQDFWEYNSDSENEFCDVSLASGDGPQIDAQISFFEHLPYRPEFQGIQIIAP